jgi:FKBP-type peptidyl-prolyl cis-trans isomerase
MFLRIVSVALVGALTLAACGSDGGDDSVAAEDSRGDEAEASEEDPASEDTEDTADAGAKPVVEIPAGEAPEGLEIIDLVEGEGAEAAAGDLVTAHYVGVLHDDGTEFDSSWDRGQPFEFQLGGGQVIVGWDEGIEGMKVGGRRMLVIPSDLAYGEAGSGGTIGPDAALVFVVDLVDLLVLPDPSEEPTVEIPDEVTGELEIVDVVEGDGEELEAGDTATIHYVLALKSSGQTEDSSWAAQPVTVPIGTGNVIAGWDEGLLGMKEGGRRFIVVPPEMGFGDEGNGPIPPGDTLIFMVDLLKVS